jgi:hypothetical protein
MVEFASGSLQLDRVSVTGNKDGGVQTYDGGDGRITASTIANNTTTGPGAGVQSHTSSDPSLLQLFNVTIAGNKANTSGGGLLSEGAAATTKLFNTTVARNVSDADNSGSEAGGGLIQSTGSVLRLRSSVVANNTRGTGPPTADDCAGTISSGGHNVVDLACPNLSSGNGDRVVGTAKVGQLGNNGGPTLTIPLLVGSKAINFAGSGAPAADQRGAPRSDPDSGSYERVSCQSHLVNRVGTGSAETLRGTSGADGLLALGGDDRLLALGGNDGLCGGTGDDQTVGGPGTDRCDGGPGQDSATGCEFTTGIP